MLRLLSSGLAGTVLLLLWAGPVSAQPGQSVYGFWETRGDQPSEVDFIVELQPCREASDELCCEIEWLAPDEPHTDTRNPDPDLRGRSLIGVQFFSGFEQEESGRWTGGLLYNPRNGRRYSGFIEQLGPDRLKIKGCAFLFFCTTQIWHRVPADDPRLDHAEDGPL